VIAQTGETPTRWNLPTPSAKFRLPDCCTSFDPKLVAALFVAFAPGRSSFPLKFEAFLELANFLPNSIVNDNY